MHAALESIRRTPAGRIRVGPLEGPSAEGMGFALVVKLTLYASDAELHRTRPEGLALGVGGCETPNLAENQTFGGIVPAQIRNQSAQPHNSHCGSSRY